MTHCSSKLDRLDRQIICATQDGLSLTPDPYGAVGEKIGLTGAEVRRRLERMLEDGIIRRIGAVPNHYALGLSANGMSVWDVEDEQISNLGEQVGKLDFVSHCYCRPRHLPLWPYNLFAMLHGANRGEVREKMSAIALLLGTAARSHDILFSTQILKKTGLRIGAPKKE